MTITLDHIFICTAAGAAEACELLDFGLSEGAPIQHTGQGTRSRRFFFFNAVLELLWVDDPAQVRQAPAAQTRLWERWSGRAGQASPFGIGFRSDGRPAAPFLGWSYRPDYLPESRDVLIADTPLNEPMWLYQTWGSRPDTAGADRQPLEHPAGLAEITGLRLIGPFGQPSAAARALAGAGLVSLEEGERHFLELVFDHGRQGMQVSFWPELPLAFRW